MNIEKWLLRILNDRAWRFRATIPYTRFDDNGRIVEKALATRTRWMLLPGENRLRKWLIRRTYGRLPNPVHMSQEELARKMAAKQHP